MQNAIEHAFAGRTNGKLTVRFNDSGGCYELLIADNGVGLPPDFSWQQSSSLGLKIIKTMAEADLKGSFALVPLADGGVQASVIIPKGGVEK